MYNCPVQKTPVFLKVSFTPALRTALCPLPQIPWFLIKKDMICMFHLGTWSFILCMLSNWYLCVNYHLIINETFWWGLTGALFFEFRNHSLRIHFTTVSIGQNDSLKLPVVFITYLYTLSWSRWCFCLIDWIFDLVWKCSCRCILPKQSLL